MLEANTPASQTPNNLEPAMTELAFLHHNEPMTTSLLIADGVDLQHKNVIELVRKYTEQLMELGPLAFETRMGEKLPQGGFGKATEIALLNEQQATLLVTFMRNSAIVVKFKVALVKAFFELRDRIKADQIPRPDGQLFLSHRADIFVAADRSFRAAMRSGRSAGLKMPQALRQANQIALEKTGINMLAELQAEEHLADLDARAARPASESAAPKSVQDFWHGWFGGQLGLPYQSCLTGQAYRAYQHWCKVNHARWLAQGDFTSHLLRHGRWHGQRLEQRVVRLNPGSTEASIGRLLLVGELPFDQPIGIWASEQVRHFEKHLQGYCAA